VYAGGRQSDGGNYRGEHKLALANGTATAKKAENEDDGTDDDDDPRGDVHRMCMTLNGDHVGKATLVHLRPDTDRQQRAADQLHTHTHTHTHTWQRSFAYDTTAIGNP